MMGIGQMLEHRTGYRARKQISKLVCVVDQLDPVNCGFKGRAQIKGCAVMAF